MDDFRVVHIGGDGLEISARMRDEARMKLQIPFEALYQAENAMLAVRTLDVLRSGGKCSRKGSRVPGHGPVGAAKVHYLEHWGQADCHGDIKDSLAGTDGTGGSRHLSGRGP